MGRLTTIEIEEIENGYVVEDFWNTKVFCENKTAVIDEIERIFNELVEDETK